MTLKTSSTGKKNDKVDFIKRKKFYYAKDPVKRMKREATHWEKIFAKY